MVETVLGDRRRASAWFATTANTIAPILAGAVGVDPDQVKGTIPAASQMLDWLEGALRQRSAPVAWYRTALPGPEKARGIDGLVELARLADDEATLDDVLVRAMLEDLRRAYDPRLLRLYARRRRCLTVLDNAHTPVLRRFVEIVTRERDGDGRESDPLLILEVSDRRFPAHGVLSPDQWRPRQLDHATPEDWSVRRDQEPGWAVRYPIAWGVSTHVAPETRPEGPARSALFGTAPIGNTPLPRGTRAALTAVRRLTAHHPQAVALVLEALTRDRDARRPGDEGIDPGAVRGVLAVRIAGEVLDDVVFASLVLRSYEKMVFPHLARAALCRTLSPAHLAPVFAQIGDDARSRRAQTAVDAFVGSDVWVELPEAGSAARPSMVHPFIRRVVAHRIGRGTWEGVSWSEEHERQRDAATDSTTRLYHDLAAGNVASTAIALGAAFSPGRDGWEVDSWLATLEAVTSAPVRDPARESDASAHLAAIVAEAGTVEGPVQPVLVAALQLHTDPLADPTHQLCETIAYELGRIVPRAGAASRNLINRMGDFNACAQR